MSLLTQLDDIALRAGDRFTAIVHRTMAMAWLHGFMAVDEGAKVQPDACTTGRVQGMAFAESLLKPPGPDAHPVVIELHGLMNLGDGPSQKELEYAVARSWFRGYVRALAAGPRAFDAPAWEAVNDVSFMMEAWCARPTPLVKWFRQRVEPFYQGMNIAPPWLFRPQWQRD